jgi:outer membrane biosynthesis protein TonB
MAVSFTLTGCSSNSDTSSGGSLSADTDIIYDMPTVEDEVPPVPEDDTQTPETDNNAESKPEAPAQKPSSSETTQSQPAAKPAAKQEEPAKSNSSSSSTPAADNSKPAASETPKQATKADAQKYIGSSVSSMISAIGSPSSKSYSSSCMGDGEDGELHYDGFTVYTYKEGSSEKVVDVE